MSNELLSAKTYRVERTLKSGAYSSTVKASKPEAHDAALAAFRDGAPVREVRVSEGDEVVAVYTREIRGGRGYAVVRRRGQVVASYSLAGR